MADADWKNDGTAVLAFRAFRGLSDSVAVQAEAHIEALEGAATIDADQLEAQLVERVQARRASLPPHISRSDNELRNEVAGEMTPELLAEAQRALEQAEAAASAFDEKLAGWEAEARRVKVPAVEASDVDAFHRQAVTETRRVARLLEEAAARDRVREMDLAEQLELHATTDDPLLLAELERQLRRQLAKATPQDALPAGLQPEERVATYQRMERERLARLEALDEKAAGRVPAWQREQLAALRARRDGWAQRIRTARQIVNISAQQRRLHIREKSRKGAA